jgi:hypothetical protein
VTAPGPDGVVCGYRCDFVSIDPHCPQHRMSACLCRPCPVHSVPYTNRRVPPPPLDPPFDGPSNGPKWKDWGADENVPKPPPDRSWIEFDSGIGGPSPHVWVAIIISCMSLGLALAAIAMELAR